MNYKNDLILIAGPAASGKTSLIRRIKNSHNVKIMKPADCYIEIAREKNIPIEQSFEKVKREDAEERFCNVCKENKCVIGDQHLAIQFKRDSMMATANTINDNYEEEYTPAISNEFIEKLQKNDINILIILLYANPECLYERAKKRYKDIGHTVRNKNIEEVKNELEAETKFFKQLIDEKKLDNYIINTTNKTEKEIYYEVIQKMNEFKEKQNTIDDLTR